MGDHEKLLTLHHCGRTIDINDDGSVFISGDLDDTYYGPDTVRRFVAIYSAVFRGA